nr:hypothetical protein [Kibdelosporangium sp. MJ126-NF4]CEL18467.1 hypothetical protein [Kibdelosporangium sp. MJ126-NF4]CTQ97950.1 hypothetical protein [Kibdelosporangium sp. MJ126-NF4]
MTSRLEQRYRGLLRLLPRWYREKRADEMVDTFISGRQDDIDQEYGWPGWRETGSVAMLAVRTRLAGADAPPRAVALGDTVRLIALLGLLMHAVTVVGDVGRDGVLQLFARMPLSVALSVPVSVPLDMVRVVSLVASVGAFVLILTRWRGAAKALALVAVVPELVWFGVVLGSDVPATAWVWHGSLLAPLLVATACVFVGFHREAPSPSRRPWLLALLVGAVVALSWQAFAFVYSTITNVLVFNPWTLQSLMVIVAGVVVLLRATPPHVRLGMAIYAAVLLPQRAIYAYQTVELRAVNGPLLQTAENAAIAEVLCLFLIGVALAVPGVRRYRRLVT